MPLEFWDISVAITDEMPVWPKSAGLSFTRVHELCRGDAVNESRIALGTHVGTHIDAPLHFLAGGTPVDRLPLDALVGTALVIQTDATGQIDVADLEPVVRTPATRLLFKTRNSANWRNTRTFDPDYVSVGLDAARWLVDHGVVLVGVDYLSVEAFGGNGDVHRTLLGAGVVVVEGLDLSNVETGMYWLACLPIRLTGAEGGPARAVLMRPLPQGAAV